MLRYKAVRPTLLTNRPPLATALVSTIHKEKEPHTLPSSCIL
jgi:hypothetical protein